MAPTVPIEFTGQKESRKYSLSQTMGKSRKYSKGLSSGFVSDSRHVVETIDESDGFGSAAQVENEAIAIENSRAPKRKCISLNSSDNFGVGLQVLSVSKMTPSERKDLESKLKMELEQVRAIQKKFSSVGTLSTSSYTQSYDVGQRGASFENLNRPSQVSASKGKKRPTGTQAKKNNFGPAKPTAAAVSTSNAALVKQCETLLNRLMAHQYAWIFNTPVDAVKLNIPDYFTVIKHPMDLGTVKSNIVLEKYRDLMDFAADVRLTFSNAMAYNPPENDVHFMASSLSKYFEVRWKGIEKKLPLPINVPSRVQMDTEASVSVPLSTNEQITTDDFYGQLDSNRKAMTDEEKHKVSLELESLSTDLPQSIITFLKEHSSSSGQNSEDEIEIDIYALSDDTLFTLRKLLDDCLLKQKPQVKAESFDLERQHESGIHNSSIEACKGNDPIDEDVDIVGGNDHPVSTYLPSEIDNDVVCRRTEGDSSCTSSGDSGSSSSDSGSGGSSESESEDANAVGPSSITKEIMGDKTTSDHQRVQLGDSENPTYSENEVGIIDPNFQPESVSLKTDSQQEVDSAPSERQVSPEKLYRAALLRNRFADTILKAREKAFEKGDKLDPEKLRLERDELERRQKEEKARLQAEAKAAEEARRKAAREAAAEAKRKRELEREAARQALLKMEKTVEINGNSLFMEDLEMLRVSHEEDLPTSGEQPSPDHLSSGLGSFKLQGSSNPLEQLGLYMKKEDGDFDDDEAEEPQGSEPANDDVEEGEID